MIPARAGSKGLERKNARTLGGIPLLQWTTEAVLKADLASAPCVLSTDDEAIAGIGRGSDHRSPLSTAGPSRHRHLQYLFRSRACARLDEGRAGCRVPKRHAASADVAVSAAAGVERRHLATRPSGGRCRDRHEANQRHTVSALSRRRELRVASTRRARGRRSSPGPARFIRRTARSISLARRPCGASRRCSRVGRAA